MTQRPAAGSSARSHDPTGEVEQAVYTSSSGTVNIVQPPELSIGPIVPRARRTYRFLDYWGRGRPRGVD
jgi:hypothetical protein